MKHLLTAITMTVGLTLGGAAVAAPASAATTVNVDSFVVQDPSLDGCDLGNGIALVGFNGVRWELDGKPISPTPAGATLWLPNGFKGTVTATAEPGFELYEIDQDRSGSTLSWSHVVTSHALPCQRAATAEQTANDFRAEVVALREQVAAQTARADRLQRVTERRAEKIKALRAKIRSLR